MKIIKDILTVYKSPIYYIIFGIFTTLINWITYLLFYNVLKASNVFSTIIAWIISVGFAFITNKIWVFKSKSFRHNTLFYELWTFVTARFATGILDIAIMYLAVDVCSMNASIWKLIANIIVIILNYAFSKLFVFKKTV